MPFGMLPADKSKFFASRLPVLLAWLVSMYFFAHAVQNDWLTIILPAAASFCIFFAVVKYDLENWLFWLVGALLARVIFVFAFPGLSDDIYRFYFDGKILLSGQSPYGIIPSTFQENAGRFIPDYVYEKMNSPDYYTVYPPLAQFVYGLPAIASDIYQYKILLSLLIISIEAAGIFFTLKMLTELQYKKSAILLYALNPLVIAEGAGNLHAEVIMVSFLAVFLYYFIKKKLVLAGIFFSLSVAVKLLPLLLLPLLYTWLEGAKKKKFLLAAALTSVVLFLPFMMQPGFFSILDSLDLYFRKFEFNGGVYLILRQIGYWLSGYNLIQYIGPLTGLATLWYILRAARFSRGIKANVLLLLSLQSWFVYLLLTATVHPWYIIPLVFLSMLIGKNAGIIWSGLVILSYIHYDPELADWTVPAIAAEYILLFIFLKKDVFFDRTQLFPERQT